MLLHEPRSSVEAKYQAIAHIASEVLWVCSLESLVLFIVVLCDNKFATFVDGNHVFHDCTKHIVVIWQFIMNKEVVVKKDIFTPFCQI